MKKHIILIITVIILTLNSCTTASNDAGPANPFASVEAKALYSKMQQLSNKGIMIGHQDDIVYGHSWKGEGVSDIKQVCDDYPAVFGWELGDLELCHATSLDSVSFDEIRNGIKWVHANGGINTISWHGNNPFTGGNAWDVSSDQVVNSVLPGGEKNEAFTSMLNELAQFFATLTDEQGQLIPFIFRPYHEHTGSWFWWGQKICMAEEYINLWKFTVDFFRSKGMHQILYAYSPAAGFESEEAYLERYPGDSLIDLLGLDIYQRGIEQKEKYIRSLKEGLDLIEPLAGKRKKLLIVAETGLESVPDSAWFTGTLWPAIADHRISYVLLWRNAHDKPAHYYAPFPGQKSAGDFVAFSRFEKTLFLNDLQH